MADVVQALLDELRLKRVDVLGDCWGGWQRRRATTTRACSRLTVPHTGGNFNAETRCKSRYPAR